MGRLLCRFRFGGWSPSHGRQRWCRWSFAQRVEESHVAANPVVVTNVVARLVSDGQQLFHDVGILFSEVSCFAKIDVKVNHIESPDEVADRIERAERALGPGRVKWVHPDCGFWMLKRSVADSKIEALVRGRDTYLGRA